MKVTIVIRFTDPGAGSSSHSDLNIPLTVNLQRDDVNQLVNTSWIKLMIRNKVAGTERRRLRLIYNGRVLNDETNFKQEVLGPKLKQLSNAQDEQGSTVKIYIHCLIGDELTAAQLEQEKEMDRRSQQHTTTSAPVIGFDRLLSQGVSLSDVNDLRRQFQQMYFPDAERRNDSGVADVEEDETRQEIVRQLEERWLESTNNGSTTGGGRFAPESARDENITDAGAAAAERAAAEMEGSRHNENLLVGLLIGTFLGAIALVFLAMDDSPFNDTQKMAMVLGISINMFIAFMRVGTVYSA